MHKNTKKLLRWKGAASDFFEENQGTRQGSRAASEEYKSYNGSMLHTLESLCDNDTISGHSMSVVAVADDTAPSSRHLFPRSAISHMQVLLYAVEDHARQLHIEFGVEKCQLLITAKPAKLRKTNQILEGK